MSRGYLLSLPALLLFAGLLILPLGLTLVLSFNVFDYQVGVKADEWTLAHYLALFSDAYFYEIFWRTFLDQRASDAALRGDWRARSLHPQPHGYAVALDLPDPDPHAVVDFGGGASVRLEPAARRRRAGQPGDPGIGRAPGEAVVHAVRGDHCAGTRDAAVHDHSSVDLPAKARPLGRTGGFVRWARARPR